jgi:hypothetical protein
MLNNTGISEQFNKTFYHTNDSNVISNSRNSVGNSKSKLFSPTRG